MKKLRGLPPAVLLAVAIMFLLAGPASSRSLELNPIDPFLRGETVELDNFTTLEGKDFSFQDYRGKKIVIAAFWLPTCDLCIEQFAVISDFMKDKKRAKNVEVVTFVRAEDDVEREFVDTVVKRNSIPFKVVLDPRLDVARHFSVTNIPSYVVIDKEGTLVIPGIHYPDRKIRDFSLLELVDRMVAGKPVDNYQLIPYTDEEKLRGMIGTEAPDFTLGNIDGGDFTLSDYRGRMNVLLAFWHPYCTFCVTEMKKLEKYYAEHRKDFNFVLLSVSSIYGPSQEDAAIEFSNEINHLYPILVDEFNVAGHLYNVEKSPTFFFIDKNGVIVDVFQGDTKKVENRYTPVFEVMNKSE